MAVSGKFKLLGVKFIMWELALAVFFLNIVGRALARKIVQSVPEITILFTLIFLNGIICTCDTRRYMNRKSGVNKSYVPME
ncbi:hypothetical protein [Pseudoalteromonas atlantica]|uniref:hypothetical protein n=1 Tax=Pseudoalteromonas atlantica TaxID=288 RepID=UPI0037367A45